MADLRAVPALMPWVYFDDHVDEHPKTIAAGDAAMGFLLRLVAFCRRNQNGGRLPKTLDRIRADKAKVRVLVKVGYLEDRGDHYQIHDYDVIYFKEDEERRKRSEKAKRAADARWNAQKDAQALPEHVPEQCSSDALRVRADPLPHSPSSKSSSSEPLAALDDDELLGRTWKLLAHRRLAKREADVGSVGSRDAWLRSVQAGLPRDYGDEARALLANEGGWTPELLADALEPPVVEISKPPDPLEATAAAAQKLREKHALPPCAGCDSTGWVDTESGVVPCEKCERTREAG